MSNGKSRLFNVILVCSLAINLLFVGGLVGRILMHPGPMPGPMPDHFGWMIRQLDNNKREELGPEFEARARRVVPLRREIREAQREFEAALLEPEMDVARIDAALNHLRSSSEAFQQEMHEQMLAIIKRLNPEERARVVKFLRHRGGDERFRGRPRGRDRPDEP